MSYFSPIQIINTDYAFGSTETTKQSTHGFICFDPDLTIKYEEKLEDDDTTIVSDITVCYTENKVTIKRVGEINNTLIIEIDKKNHIHYNTPYGYIDAFLMGEKIDFTTDGRKSILSFEYTIEMDSYRARHNSKIIFTFKDDTK